MLHTNPSDAEYVQVAPNVVVGYVTVPVALCVVSSAAHFVLKNTGRALSDARRGIVRVVCLVQLESLYQFVPFEYTIVSAELSIKPSVRLKQFFVNSAAFAIKTGENNGETNKINKNISFLIMFFYSLFLL